MACRILSSYGSREGGLDLSSWQENDDATNASCLYILVEHEMEDYCTLEIE
jgi:hypothetical protein